MLSPDWRENGAFQNVHIQASALSTHQCRRSLWNPSKPLSLIHFTPWLILQIINLMLQEREPQPPKSCFELNSIYMETSWDGVSQVKILHRMRASRVNSCKELFTKGFNSRGQGVFAQGQWDMFAFGEFFTQVDTGSRVWDSHVMLGLTSWEWYSAGMS